MRSLLWCAAIALICSTPASADDPKKAPEVKVVTAEEKPRSVSLAELAKDGPVLVRLTCACSGCDAELPHFKKLAAAYKDKGFKTLAIFKDSSEAVAAYGKQQKLDFPYAADPDGKLWETFDTKAMPTNILVAKGGAIESVVKGCATDGSNAELLSAKVAKLLKTEPVPVVQKK